MANILAQKTFRQLTAPGFFNFSATQSATTAKVETWFNTVAARCVQQANLYDSFFRQWVLHDYSTATVTRTPFIDYLLRQWGIGWFLGTDTQAAGLISYVSRSYPLNTADNLLYLFSVLAESPFLWVTGTPQITYGSQIPAYYAEVFLIYSTSVSAPATPSAQAYEERAWDAPTGWSKTANAATYYSYGYLSGGNIVWLAPVSTATAVTNSEVLNLAALPGSPSTGDTAGVEDDGTGDTGARYYYDGGAWRKVSSPNANQGIITNNTIPTPRPSLVWAPETTGPSIVSEEPPPADGPSAGYGMYGGWSEFTLRSREIDVTLTLTTAGAANLGIIVNLLRRLKPTLNRLLIFYTVDGVTTEPTQLEIKDAGSVI